MIDKNPTSQRTKKNGKLLASIGTIGLLLPLISLSLWQSLSQEGESSSPEVWKGMHSNIAFNVEVANTKELREKGLMKRDTLEENSGMLFVFDRPGKHCFWMKQTYIPLSLAFIDTDETISSIKQLEPLDKSPVCSSRPVIRAVEMSHGWFSDNDIEVGDSIRFFSD